jgi:membrane protease YdiL (CAAX protease family)
MKQRNAPSRLAIIFTIYAFAISWMCWLPVVAADHQIGTVSSSAVPFLVLLGTFGPFFAAVAMVSRTAGVAGLREFIGQAFRWRVGVQWYVAAAIAPFAIRMAVLYIHVLKGGTFPDLTDTTRWLAVPSTFLMVFFLGGPTGEEFGWRGFLLQRVQPMLGMLGGSMVIGVISALWHLPLFWIDGTAQSHLPFALFAVRTVSLSIISTWLYNGTRRSLLFVLLFHASLNTWPNTLNVLETEGTIGPYISTTIIYTGWACQLFLLGLIRGRGDRRREPSRAPTIAA